MKFDIKMGLYRFSKPLIWTRLLLLSCLCISLFYPIQCLAFYTWENEKQNLELRGMVRVMAQAIHNPDNSLLYPDSKVRGIAAVSRFILNADLNEQLSLEAQTVQSYIPDSIQSAGSRIKRFPDSERSDSLNWSADKHQARIFLDRLNIQYESDNMQIKLGRQPINLAATNYFTPNDFFAPFAAQTFYRAYKPGVDALRSDIQLGELSQLTLLGVLGYSLTADNDTFWSSNPKDNRNSFLARASSVWNDFEIALLIGSIKKDTIVGLDLQGELWEWLGVRAEGHYRIPKNQQHNEQQDKHLEFALGIEHRWENTLTLRLEQFYHGQGTKHSDDYLAINAVSELKSTSETAYLARHYSAFGASYEMTPLLNTDFLYLYNWIDQSRVFALNAVYSLSDEAELVFNLTLPMGKTSQGSKLKSEFGNQGKSIGVEWRVYF